MRSFVAIDLDAPLRSRLAELQTTLRRAAAKTSWVKPENLHLTLRFLGEADPEALRALASSLATEISCLPGFTLHFRGCGVFPPQGRPRVLWVGVAEPPSALFDVQAEVERLARESGFAPDDRRFEPHLTLARFRQKPRGLGSVLRDHSGLELGAIEVENIRLYESRLSDQGSIYRLLAELPLAEPAGREN